MADNPRVLVVEDEPADNTFLCMTVRGLGHAAESCLDGQAAIAWLQDNKPSLVFLDALLPKADGFAVLREIKRLYPDVLVYMMSGVYKKKSYEQEAVTKLGATAYLHKPLGVLQVWEILERCLPPVPASETAQDFPGVPFWRRPLPAVVADLHVAAKTGLLYVRGNGGSGILFFEDGNLIFGRCNDPQLRIDRVLMQLGKLRKDQLPRVSEIAAQARGRVGDALVAEKMITAADLAEALALQQRNHVTRPLTWTQGSCWFFASESPRAETFKMKLDVPALIYWSCRHLEVDEHLIRYLPRPERKIRATKSGDELARSFGLSNDEARLVDLMDGTRTLGQIRGIGRMMQIDSERVLAGLTALQLLELGPEAEARIPLAPLFGSTVPVAGDLSRFPAALLLVSMAFSRKTGMLQLESEAGQDKVHRIVNFMDGDIASASSSDAGDRIGQVLLRVGLITREQLQAALAAAQANGGAALGRVLVSMGMITPDGLHGALVHQAQQVITGLIGWRGGSFQFQENDGPGRDVVPLGLDTRQALMTALRTCPFSDIAPRLPSPETRLRSTTTAHQLAADLPLTELENRLRREADGSCTVQDIARMTPEGPEAALRAIFTLTTIGLVEGFVATLAPVPSPVNATRPAGPVLALAGDDDDPAISGELTGERARGARVLAVDESFEGANEEPAAAESSPSWRAETSFGDAAAGSGATLLEDWSSAEEGSFAGLGDMPSAAAQASFTESPSFEGLAAAVASAATESGFAFDAFVAGLGDSLPLDGGRELPLSAPTSGGTALAVSAPTLTAAQAAAVSEFLVQLGGWVRTCPEAVPESIRNLLPNELRVVFGL